MILYVLALTVTKVASSLLWPDFFRVSMLNSVYFYSLICKYKLNMLDIVCIACKRVFDASYYISLLIILATELLGVAAEDMATALISNVNSIRGKCMSGTVSNILTNS